MLAFQLCTDVPHYQWPGEHSVQDFKEEFQSWTGQPT